MCHALIQLVMPLRDKRVNYVVFATDALLLRPYGTGMVDIVFVSTDATLLCPYGTGDGDDGYRFYRRFAVTSLRDGHWE
jgi:hypothetical protein